MEIHKFSTIEVLRKTADALNSLLTKKNFAEILFLTSGGSCLQLLDLIDMTMISPKTTISVLDERYSTDPCISNMAQLEATTFYRRALANGAHFIDTKMKNVDTTIQNNESKEQLAERFEQSLRDWKKEKNGIIIATVGIGSDGHTSGILPGLVIPNDTWVFAYDSKPFSRVTTTFSFLKIIDYPIIFATGENKKEALEKLVSKKGTVTETPARIWLEVPNTELFTDQTF